MVPGTVTDVAQRKTRPHGLGLAARLRLFADDVEAREAAGDPWT